MNSRKLNLLGRKFGRLTVIQEVGKVGDCYNWKCACDCGKILDVVGSILNTGAKKSCGCLRTEKTIERNKSRKGVPRLPALERFLSYAIKEYDKLPPVQVRSILGQNCHYCGQPPNQIFRGNCGEIVLYTGIDRVDNKIGYEPNNVVPCCSICNIAKNNHTVEEWEDWLERVSKLWG